MSTKGFIKIPESQLHLEQMEKKKSRTWHNNIMNLLLRKNVCGTCLRIEDDLVSWDAEFVLCYENDIESSLKNIMISTFGPNVTSMIPATIFCQKCVDTILNAHIFILQLRENCKNIQKTLKEISQQMKWTAYLDENGSLTETIMNNKVMHDDDDLILDNEGAAEKQVKTHRIILNDESLKSRLLGDAEMHKFLIQINDVRSLMAEPKLPEGITVNKVVKSVDMSDFAPHDVLELNWAEDEDESIRDTQINNKLQSNEALIMNLMEEAKTNEKHKHFNENINIQSKETLSELKDKLADSLSVELIQNQLSPQPTAEEDENYNDNDDLVPSDLLELTWPDEPNETTQKTKIPVKKLNFNEALTVKFIPAHKLIKVKDSVTAESQNLLELSSNEQDDARDDLITNKKHSIDLTKWLQDQGMNTIKAKNFTYTSNSTQDLDIEAYISKKVKLENKNDSPEDVENQATVSKAVKCNITVKNLEVLQEPGLDDNNMDEIRCGLCSLTFILFESYWSHYKTHTISETAKCYRCTGKFPVIELLVEHLLLVHSEDMTYCTLCYAIFKQDKLAKHMGQYHAKKVEIINASIKPSITKDGKCKKCNQPVDNYPNSPHICVFHTTCVDCKEECVHQKFLESYLEQIKENKLVYKCVDCDYMYKTKQDIIKHANSMHLHIKPHQCVLCKLSFLTLNELNKHNHTSHVTCGRCKKVFTEKDQLYNHNCPKHVSLFTCEACGQKFNNERCYKRHKQTAMAVGDECSFCKDSVPNRCNMSRHMQAKHQVFLKKKEDRTVFECTICQKAFKFEVNFRIHPCLYGCKICERRFMNKALYERHMRTHIGLRTHWRCPECDFMSLDKLSHINHMKTHTKKNRKAAIQTGVANSLKCPHCPLFCENANQYEVHVNRFHLMCRPYQCDICKKSFYGKQRLREHIKQHSSQRRNVSAFVPFVKCPVCDKRFATTETMEKHFKVHSIRQLKLTSLFKCDVCEKIYISPALLEEHKTQCHNDLPKAETSRNSL